MRVILSEIFKRIKKFLKTADLILFFLCFACSVFGIVVISSATKTLSGGSGRYITVQSIALLLGVVAYILVSIVDIEFIASLWKGILVFNVVAILLLIPFGISGGTGNKNWLDFFFLPFQIQPAEIVKLSFTILLAKQIAMLQDRINKPLSLLSLLIHLGFMAAIIYFISSDVGMILVYVFIFICMLFASGVKLRWFALSGAVLLAAFPIIWNVFLDGYQRMRVLVVLNPELDPLDKGYHAIQSKLAIGAGQLFGQGLYNGNQTQSSRLFAKHTDFIFSTIGEELGLVGCCCVILLLSAIIVRCLYVSAKARPGVPRYTACGITAMLMFQCFINIGMCIGFLPIIGLTLPFFSYGGSSLVTFFAAMGIVSGIHMRPIPAWLRYQTGD